MEPSIENPAPSIFPQKSRLIRLTPDYIFKPFDCGIKDLNEFLYSDAKVQMRHLRYTTFIIETDERIIAYYSLANDLLMIEDSIEDFCEENEETINKIDTSYYEEFINSRTFPAVKLGRFAVDKKFQGKSIGSTIIKAIVVSFIEKNKTGCQFITVDAINCNQTLSFYEKNGFKNLTVNDVCKESRQMYKPLLKYIDISTTNI